MVRLYKTNYCFTTKECKKYLILNLNVFLYNKRMKKYIFLLLIIYLFVGCQSTGFLMGKAKVTMINEPYPAKNENYPIEIYITNIPSKPYIELAQISCNDTNEEWCLKQIKIKAREIGADGIIILGKSSTGSIGIPIGNVYYIENEDYGMKAVAFKYK